MAWLNLFRLWYLPLRWLSMLMSWKGILLRTMGDLALRTSEQYIYTELDTSKREIRLLSIDAVSQNTYVVDSSATSPKTAKILYVSLDNIPIHEAGTYTALSYTWGTSEPTHKMSVSGKVFDIRENLYEALIHLHKAGVTRVWVDAICINQKDDHERGLQVQRMGDIYREANEAIAWLGTHRDGSTALFRWIETCRKDGTIFDRRTPIPLEHDEALTELAKRPYFSRMWVVQEYALAKDLRIMCGNNFEEPGLMGEIFERYAFLGKSGRLSPGEPLVMLKQVRKLQQEGTQLGLLDLLRHINSVYDKFHRNVEHMYKTSDMIDQIYGLLGLVHDGQQFVPRPDYELNMNQLFEHMTRSIIKNSKRLDYVFLAAGEKTLDLEVFGAKNLRKYEPTGLPSWCPDYINLLGSPLNAEITCAVDFSSTPSYGMNGFGHRYGEPRLSWHATQSSTLTDSDVRTDARKQLHVRGMLVGKVLACPSLSTQLSSAPLASLEPDDSPMLAGLIQLLYTYSSSPLPCASDAIKALVLALHFQLHTRPFPDHVSQSSFKRRLEGNHHDELKWLIQWAIQQQHLDNLTSPHVSEWDRLCELSCQLTESTNKNYGDFRRRVASFSPDTSAKSVVNVVGKYGPLAWAPLKAEPGDEIWLLKGCSMPIVLRRILRDRSNTSNLFVQIGPAVVNGAMSGDMWSENDLDSIAIV